MKTVQNIVVVLGAFGVLVVIAESAVILGMEILKSM
jgi:hypothetical protein